MPPVRPNANYIGSRDWAQIVNQNPELSNINKVRNRDIQRRVKKVMRSMEQLPTTATPIAMLAAREGVP